MDNTLDKTEPSFLLSMIHSLIGCRVINVDHFIHVSIHDLTSILLNGSDFWLLFLTQFREVSPRGDGAY